MGLLGSGEQAVQQPLCRLYPLGPQRVVGPLAVPAAGDSPASHSTFMWWERVDWLICIRVSSTQAQRSPSLSVSKIRQRFSSPRP